MGRMGKGGRREPLAKLRGVVRAHGADPVVLRLAELEVDGATRFAPQIRLGFDLETDAGKRIAVSLPVDVEAAPLVERKAQWEDIEADEEAAPFREDAPAPHVKVRLRTFVLRDGDVVHLWGHAARAMGSASFRDQAEQEIVSIEVVACGTGEEGAAKIDELEKQEAERQRPPGQKRLPLARVGKLETTLLGVVAVGALALPFLGRAAARNDVYGIIALVAGCVPPSLFLFSKRFRFHREDAKDPSFEDRRGVIVGIALVFVALFGSFAAIDLSGDDEGPFNHAPIVVTASGVCAIALAFYFAWATRREARIARAMLAAPMQPIPWEHNKWGATEGSIATGSKKHEIEAAAFSLFDETWSDGSGGNGHVWSTEAGPFVLDADGTATVRVQATKADWGTTVRWRKDGPPVTKEHRKELREVALMPVGGRVLVVGRIKVRDGMAELVSTGNETLLLYTTQGESPRAVLRGQLVTRAAIIGLVLLLGLTELAVVATGVFGTIHSGSGGD